MKEDGKDRVETGFRTPGDGWHIVEFQQGIDYLPGKGGEGIYQNERGFKTYKLPALVKDDTDPDDGADISQLVGVEKGGPWLANILACVGLWDAVKAKFPGPDISVFDQPVIDGIKARLPGCTCMMKTEQYKDKDDQNRARVRVMCSIAKYKEILKEEKEKAATGKKGTKTPEKAEPGGMATGKEDW